MRTGHASPPVPVREAIATIGLTSVEFGAIGTIQTVTSATVKSRFDAVIHKVLISDGRAV